MQDDLNQQDPLVNNDQQYKEDDLNFLLDSYQRRGYNANEMARLANAQGYDPNMVMFNLNDRMEQARSDAEEERRKALDELREFRIAEKTREARLNIQDEYKNEEFMYEADNQFNQAYSNKLLTSQYIQALQEGNFLSGDLSRMNSYLEENGITTSLQKKDVEETETVDKVLKFMPGMFLTQPVLNYFGMGAQGQIQDFYGSTSQPSEEDVQETLQGLQSLSVQDDLKLRGAVDMQNRINSALGFETTFEADSPSDLDFINADVNRRTGFADAYENGTNIGGISEGLFDYVEDVTGDPGFVRGTVGEVFSLAANFPAAVYEIFNSAMTLTNFPFDSVGYQRFIDRENARLAGFRNGVSNILDVNENNKSKDMSLVVTEAMQNPTAENLYQAYAKFFDSVNRVVPDVAAAIGSVGVATVGKKAATATAKQLAKRAGRAQAAYLTALGARGTAGMYNSLNENRSDLSSTEKKTMSLLVGVSEATLARVFRGMESSVAKSFIKAPKSVHLVAENRLKQAIAGITAKGAPASIFRGMVGESLEEGLQAVFSESIENLYSLSQNETLKHDFNPYVVADGFVLGGAMGAGGVGIGRLASNVGHSQYIKSIERQEAVVTALQDRIEQLPDGSKRKELRTQLLQEQDRLRKLHSIGYASYDRLTEDQQREVLKYNQELSHLRDKIKNAKGKTKEDLKAEFKRIYKLKSDIETSVMTEEEILEAGKTNPNVDRLYGLRTGVTVEELVNENPDITGHAETSAETLPDFQDGEALQEVYRLLDLAQEQRKKAQSDPANAAKHIAMHGKLQAQARNIAYEAGIEKATWVDILDNLEQGKKISVEGIQDMQGQQTQEEAAQEQAPQPEQPAAQPSAEYTLGQEGDIISITPDMTRRQVEVARTVNNLNKAFRGSLAGTNTTIKTFNSEEDFYNSSARMRATLELDLKDGAVTYGKVFKKADGSYEILLNPNAEGRDAMEEIAHVLLIPLLAQDANTRGRIYNELLALGGYKVGEDGKPVKDSSISNPNRVIANLIAQRADDYQSQNQAVFEEEVIIGFLVNYAEAPNNFGKPRDKGFIARIFETIKNLFRGKIRAGQLPSNVINFNDSLLDMAEKFRQASKFGQEMEIEADPSVDQEAVAPTVDVASRRAKPKNTWELLSDGGGEIFFKRVLSRTRADGIDVISSVFQNSIKVNDYWHFKNLYAKLTGNGAAPNLMQDMYVIRDGVKYNIRAPKPKVDSQGNIMEMKVPEFETFNQRRMRINLEEQDLTDELAKQRSVLMGEAGDLWRNNEKNISLYTNFLDFQPGEDKQYFTIRDRNVETVSTDIEKFVIAKKNIQALIDSDITEDDLKALRGRKSIIFKSDHPGLYNMSGLEQQSKLEELETQEPGDEMSSLDATSIQPQEDQDTGERSGRRSKRISIEDLLAEGDDVSIKVINKGDSDLEDEVSFEELLANPDTVGVGVVAYDQTGETEFKLFHLGDETFKVSAGMSVVRNKFKKGNPSESLSVSHSSRSKRSETLKKMKKEWQRLEDNGVKDKKMHIFVQTQGNNLMFKNPQLFKPLLMNWFTAHKNGFNGLKVEDAVREINKVMNIAPRQQAGGEGRSGFEIIESLDVFQELSVDEKAEMGYGNKFDLQTTEQTENFLNFYLDNSTNFAVAALMNAPSSEGGFKMGFVKEGLEKYNLPTSGDIAAKVTDSLYTDNMNINQRSGIISSVITVDLNQVFDSNGDAIQSRLSTDDDSAFPHEINGTISIKKLTKPMKVQTLFGISPEKTKAGIVVGGELASLENLPQRLEAEEADNVLKTIDTFVNNKIKQLDDGVIKLEAKVNQTKTLGKTVIKQAEANQNDAFLKRFKDKYEKKLANLENKLNNKKEELKGKEEYETFDRASRRKRDNTPGGPQSWTLAETSSTDRLIENFQKKIVDKYKGILNLQQQVEDQRGERLRQSEDFRLHEELMYGKAATDLERLDAKVDEITKLMKDLGVTEKEVSTYMYALHAKERNDVIEERNGKKDGSGMSTEEAGRRLQELNPKKRELDQVAKLAYDIIQNTRDTYKKLGLHTEEDIQTWEDTFENYVPLQGLAIDEENDVSSEYPTGGKGLHVAKGAVKRAQGRGSEAENILAQIIAQNGQAHIKGRTNEAVNALYNLIEENPNDNVWKVLNYADPQNPNVVGVRVDGKQKYIYFVDASHAETLRNMNMPTANLLVRALRSPANWLRMSFTTLNPEFMISNFSRDIQSAIFNAAAESEIEGGMLNGEDVIGGIMANVMPSLRSLLKDASGKDMDPEFAQYFDEFKEDGGRTGWAYQKELAQIAEQLEGETGDKTTSQNILGNIKRFGELIEGYNNAFENSIRLSSYIAARQKGISREKAAQFAKNITVNFNKHGEYGQILNSVYLFFNAAVQGSARIARSLWLSKKARKMAVGLGLFNAILTAVNAALSDDDEDGVSFYAKIPDYVKERNIIIMYDGKNYFTIPMPYGYNVFANAGTAATEVSMGIREIDESALFLFNSFVSAFSPISFGQSENLSKYAVKAISPTVIKPLIEAAVNETYFGGPVYAEQSPFGAPKPNSSMAFRSPDSVKQFFKWLNEATGGTVHRKGIVDINPDVLWYVIETYLGGAGQFITRTGETTTKIAAKFMEGGEDIKLTYNDIPLMRKLYGEPSKYYDFQKFKDREVELTQMMREYKDPETRKGMSNYKGLMPLYNLMKSTNRQLKNLRKQRREALNIENYIERTIRTQELKEKERIIVMKFNREYDKYRK
tara:strand:+ start:13691 stop:21913 length:8223 start_codon:yes stop_codon:yes gene_type:complete